MNHPSTQTTSAAQNDSAAKQQIHLTVDGCKVKLNLPVSKDETAKIESVKRMILSGLAKA